eukprot:1260-Rhodomonas_salina.1
MDIRGIVATKSYRHSAGFVCTHRHKVCPAVIPGTRVRLSRTIQVVDLKDFGWADLAEVQAESEPNFG